MTELSLISIYDEPEDTVNDMDSSISISHDPEGLFYFTYTHPIFAHGEKQEINDYSLLETLKKWTMIKSNLVRLEFHKRPNLPSVFDVPIPEIATACFLSFLKQRCAELENITQ